MRLEAPTRDRIERFVLMRQTDNILFETKTVCLPNYQCRTDVTDITRNCFSYIILK